MTANAADADDPTTPGLARAVAELACEVTYPRLPTEVVEVARHAVRDWFGVRLRSPPEAAARSGHRRAQRGIAEARRRVPARGQGHAGQR